MTPPACETDRPEGAHAASAASITHSHDEHARPQAWHRRPLWRFGLGLWAAGSSLALVGTLLGFLGEAHWFLDLFAHFRGQYFVALVAASVLMALARRPWTAAAFGVGAAINAVALAPFLVPLDGGPRPATGTDEPPLRIMTCNLLYENPDHASALGWLRSSPADVVFLCEVTSTWSAALRSLSDIYPHQHHCPQSDPFGCAVLSRRPWTHVEECQFGTFASPSLAVRMPWVDREVLVLGMHPTPPNGPRGSAYRNAALAAAAEFLASHPIRTQIVTGDLNATPWCHSMRALVASTGLVDTARGRGWQPTWNVRSPLFQLPIDHVLVSPDLVTTDRQIGPEIGSDHRAVIVTLSSASPQP